MAWRAPSDNAFYNCLISLDVQEAKALWSTACPHLPQVADDRDMLYVLHLARTEAPNVPLRLRQASHTWLKDRHLGSHLERPRQSKENIGWIPRRKLTLSLSTP